MVRCNRVSIASETMTSMEVKAGGVESRRVLLRGSRNGEKADVLKASEGWC